MATSYTSYAIGNYMHDPQRGKGSVNRLAFHLPLLVHPDQVGFIPGRQAGDNVRKAITLTHIANKQPTSTMLLSLDAQKAFDRLNWQYMTTVLKEIQIPLPFVHLLYNAPSAKVVMMGTLSEEIGIKGGT